MPLTPEERQRIYEEERARIEARAQAESDVKIEREVAQASARSKPTNALSTLVLLALLGVGVVWFHDETSNKQPSSSVSATNVSTQSSPVENSTLSAAETSLKVAADTLYQEYEANQIKADEKYKGRTLSISGTVQAIGNDILDEPYIMLRSTNDITGVQCMFFTSDKSLLAPLHKGDNVTVVGRCNGYLLNVLIQECSLVPTAPLVDPLPDDTATSSTSTNHSGDLEHPPLDSFDDSMAEMSSRTFKESWVEGFTKAQLTELRNEPYARHGYRFKDASLQTFFEAQSWYRPTTSDQSRAEAKFTQIERDNIHTVQEAERWLKHPNN